MLVAPGPIEVVHGHHAAAAQRLGVGDGGVRHAPARCGRGRSAARRARRTAPRRCPATLPWPKIAQTPAKSGTLAPSISAVWRGQVAATSACAMVRRIASVIGASLHAALSAPRARRQAFDEAFEARRHVGRSPPRRRSLPGEPGRGGIVEDRAADREALDGGAPRGDARRRWRALCRRFEAEQHDAAAIADRSRRSTASMARQAAAVGLRLELPPVGLDAERVEPLERRWRSCRRPTRPVLAGDDLEQQLAPDAAGGVEERAAARAPARRFSSAGRRDGRSTRHLTVWLDRPFGERRAESLRARPRIAAAASPAARPAGRSRSRWSAARNSASRP